MQIKITNTHPQLGYVYGLAQPCVRFSLLIKGADASDVERLTAFASALHEIDDQCVVPDTDFASPVQQVVTKLAALAVQIQRADRLPVGEAVHSVEVTETAQQAQWLVFVPYFVSQSTINAFSTMVDMWNGFKEAGAEMLAEKLSALRNNVKANQSNHVNAMAFATVAQRLRVEWVPILGTGSVCLGKGAASLWIDSTMTENTNPIGLRVAKNKNACRMNLTMAGLPVPKGQLVATVGHAQAFAEKHGFPVVIKPADTDQGRGVTADIQDIDALKAAYSAAQEHSSNILIEGYIPGYTHRLTVVAGRVINVRKRWPGGVLGDGTHTVRELRDLALQDPRNQRRVRAGRFKLELDDEAEQLLARQGLTVDSVIEAGQFVRLRARDNINAGGTNETIELADVHPDNIALAEEAAQVLRLDLAGVDVIVNDMRVSWRDQDGALCEVNGQPQFATMDRLENYVLLMNQLRPNGFSVPAELLVFDADALDADAISDQMAGLSEGAVTSALKGVWVDDSRRAGPFPNAFSAARAAMQRSDAERLFCAMSIQELRLYGSPMMAWDKIKFAFPSDADTEQRDTLRSHARHILEDAAFHFAPAFKEDYVELP